jgi:hypothetical protein
LRKGARGFTGARINLPLFFSWMQCFFILFYFYIKILAKLNPKKRKKKFNFTVEEQILKILPISVSKDREISPEKKNWLGAVVFCFLNFII